MRGKRLEWWQPRISTVRLGVAVTGDFECLFCLSRKKKGGLFYFGREIIAGQGTIFREAHPLLKDTTGGKQGDLRDQKDGQRIVSYREQNATAKEKGRGFERMCLIVETKEMIGHDKIWGHFWLRSQNKQCF